MLLRHYIEQGMSKRAIARKLKISRDTLYRWIREGALERHADEQLVEYGPRAPVPTKLDPYKPLIQERLRAFPCGFPKFCRRSPLNFVAIRGLTDLSSRPSA